jgi:hypothetical protein
VQRLAGVLFEMQPGDADGACRAVVELDLDLAAPDDGLGELRDLIALRQVRIKIILAVEHRVQVDLGVEPEPGAHRLLDGLAVDHRQHAGHRRVDQRDLGVGRGAERGGGAREQLGLGHRLGVDLEADDDFPVAGASRDQGHVSPALP